MTIRQLPAASLPQARRGLQFEPAPKALDRWNPAVRAASDRAVRAEDDEPDRTISVYDVIGYDYWTGGGVTAKRIAAALRGMGKGPVTVNVNSPGGDFFEGIAIYNLLREHEGEVTVKVLGLAASAASVIAMAGDEIQIGRAAFMMIHNAWLVAIGNRHDLREAADFIEPFDETMVDLYAARTGQESKAVAKMMDAETFIGGSKAVDLGFADSLLESDQVEESGETKAHTMRKLEAALRVSGLPRASAQRMLRDLKSWSVRDAAPDDLNPPHPSSDSGMKARASVQALAGFTLPKFSTE